MKQTITYITALFLLNSCGSSSTAVKKEAAPEEHSKESSQPSIYSSQTIEDEVEESKPHKNPPEKEGVLEEKAKSKIRVEIFFDPNCTHCHEYFKWIESTGLSKKYIQDVEFKNICVEFIGLGKEGRCREQYGQDGADNFLVLYSKCVASGDENHCGVPRVFLNGKYIKDRGNLERYIQTEQTILNSQ
ncbi:hypothetical protein HY636_05115 [Candidatus Woesearchaeota archaeon]|nr:hypothetical protein [Candidatus Woesearchaeota archaeon]